MNLVHNKTSSKEKPFFPSLKVFFGFISQSAKKVHIRLAFCLIGLLFSILLTIYSFLNFTISVEINSDGKHVRTSVLEASHSLTVRESHERPVITQTASEATTHMFVGLDQENRFSSTHVFMDSDNLSNFLLSALQSSLVSTNFTPIVNQKLEYNPQKKGLTQLYIFNPFRAKLILDIVNSEGMLFAINIPDSTIEIWQQNKNIQTVNVVVPWIRLILSGLGIPLGSAIFIASVIFLIRQLNIVICRFIRSLLKMKMNKKDGPKWRINAFARKQLTRIRLSKSLNHLQLYFFPFIWFIIGVVTVGYIFLIQVKGIPVFGDEMNYLFQAKIFSQGKIWINEPEDPHFFKVSWMDLFGHDKKIWNFHPPGNSILLSFGWIANHPELVPPFIFGLVMLIQYLLALSLSKSRFFASLYCTIFISSHYILSLASSYMAHTSSLLFISATYLFSLYYFKSKNPKLVILIAATAGFSFLIRPLSAFLGLTPLSMLIVHSLLRQKTFKTALVAFFVFVSIASFAYGYTYIVSGTWELSYIVKGPEMGKTLMKRLEYDWNWRLANTFRNVNEFQHRSHSFGFSINMIFAFLAVLLLWKTEHRWAVIFGTLTFWSYLLIHSFVHWYGWRWEPRMIYDIAFIHYLLFAGGLYGIYLLIHEYFKYFFALICLMFFILIAYQDIPKRFLVEYKSYSGNNPYVKGYLREHNIKSAIIFFRQEIRLAPYLAFNKLTFDGDIIYALDQGPAANQVLINKHPKKAIYYCDDGSIISAEYSYLLNDYDLLQGYFLERDTVKSYVNIVVPYKSIVQKLENDPSKKYAHISEQDFLENFQTGKYSNLGHQQLIAFVGESKFLLKVLDREKVQYKMQKMSGDINAVVIELSAKSTVKSTGTYGLEASCYGNADWKPPTLFSNFSSHVDISDCQGNDTSVYWKGFVDTTKQGQVTFYSRADDGLKIIVDDQTVHNNHFENGGSAGRSTSTHTFAPGKHKIEFYFYNKPGVSYLELGSVIEDKDVPLHGEILGNIIYQKYDAEK